MTVSIFRRKRSKRSRAYGSGNLARAAFPLIGLAVLVVSLPHFIGGETITVLRPRPHPLPLPPHSIGGQTITGRPVVLDGDSLRLDGRKLRLEGIDAPELDQVCERDGRFYDCGHVAKRIALAKLSAGQLACRVNGADRYGRGLALCSVAGEDLNATLVREGMAVSEGRYRDEERQARQAERGLWAGSFERPADWRRRHPRPQER